MDLSKLEMLKDKLVHGKVFADIFECFLENCGENSEFMKLGQRGRCPTLERIVSEVATKLLGKKAQLRAFLLTYLPECGFVHGGGFINGCIASVFYFEAIQQGILAVAIGAGETKFARFRGSPMPMNW